MLGNILALKKQCCTSQYACATFVRTVAEKDKRRAGANITSCQGNTYGVSGQITACRGKLRRVGANYGVSGQITSCRGKLRRVGANYVVSGQITARRRKLRRVGANYGVSGQITACRGTLRSVGANYGASGQITSCRGKLRSVGANYGASGTVACTCTANTNSVVPRRITDRVPKNITVRWLIVFGAGAGGGTNNAIGDFVNIVIICLPVAVDLLVQLYI